MDIDWIKEFKEVRGLDAIKHVHASQMMMGQEISYYCPEFVEDFIIPKIAHKTEVEAIQAENKALKDGVLKIMNRDINPYDHGQVLVKFKLGELLHNPTPTKPSEGNQ